MRLTEVAVRDKVSTGMVGDYTSLLQEKQGWELDVEGGIVTARKGATTRLIPMSNVTYMNPAEARPLAKAKVA